MSEQIAETKDAAADDMLGDKITSEQVKVATNDLKVQHRKELEQVVAPVPEQIPARLSEFDLEQDQRAREIAELRQQNARIAQMREGVLQHLQKPAPNSFIPAATVTAGSIALAGLINGAGNTRRLAENTVKDLAKEVVKDEKFNVGAKVGEIFKDAKLGDGPSLNSVKRWVAQDITKETASLFNEKGVRKAVEAIGEAVEGEKVIAGVQEAAKKNAKQITKGIMQGLGTEELADKLNDVMTGTNNTVFNAVREGAETIAENRDKVVKATAVLESSYANKLKNGGFVGKTAYAIHEGIKNFGPDIPVGIKYGLLAVTAGVVTYLGYEALTHDEKQKQQEAKGAVGEMTKVMQLNERRIAELSGAGVSR